MAKSTTSTLKISNQSSVSVWNEFCILDHWKLFIFVVIAKLSDEISDKVNVHLYNPTGQSVYYEYTKEGELIGLSKFNFYFLCPLSYDGRSWRQIKHGPDSINWLYGFFTQNPKSDIER